MAVTIHYLLSDCLFNFRQQTGPAVSLQVHASFHIIKAVTEMENYQMSACLKLIPIKTWNLICPDSDHIIAYIISCRRHRNTKNSTQSLLRLKRNIRIQHICSLRECALQILNQNISGNFLYHYQSQIGVERTHDLTRTLQVIGAQNSNRDTQTTRWNTN